MFGVKVLEDPRVVLHKVVDVCTKFYEKMHKDEDLKLFLFEEDGPGEHGKRLGTWFVEKWGLERGFTPWSDLGRYGMRQPSHYKAWTSSKRPQHRQGRRFKLFDCRIWMRLFFWSMRQVLDDDDPIFDALVTSIHHMIGVYEYSATNYVSTDLEWSLRPKNLSKYEKHSKMIDLQKLEAQRHS